MYVKVFKQTLDSSLMEASTDARLLFFYLLMMADDEGVVDMTPHALARRCNMDLEAVQRGLKELAEPDLGAEFGVPMIVLAQLNREQTRRTSDHRPRLSDLREAGEEVMDIGLLVHRPIKHMKRPQDHEKEKLAEYRAAETAAELIVDKNRNGNTGIVGVTFFGATQRWHDLPQPAIFNSKGKPPPLAV